MAFAKIIIIGVAYFLQVCLAQVNNGQSFQPNFKINSLGDPEKRSLQSIADNTNFRGNYINFAANHLSQNQLSQNRLSDFFNKKTAAPLENYQNNIFPSNSNQQQLSNLRQQNHVEYQDLPTPLAFWNTQQDPNLNNIKLTPSNELPVTSNILPAPNIAGNSFQVSNIPTQSIMPPSLTISTSLPSFISSAFPTSNYIKLQPRNQVSHETNTNKQFLALAEPPQVTTNTISGNHYYVPPKPIASDTDINSPKSLNMKTLLPLILNLLKNEDCQCCSHCKRCNNKDNLAETPLIDSGYSKQKTYGPPSHESYEDSESEEEINDVGRRNAKFYKNRHWKRKYHTHSPFDEEKESQSNED